ncbi:ABC-type transport system involved in cytochrome c biogenesis ATPase subunit [Bradyrhizobium japonicum]
MQISKFEIEGLFGDRDVTLPLEGNALLLVGPNGLGKSSVVNIFYYSISRQWKRLLDYNFERIHITINGDRWSLHRDELSGLVEIQKLLSSSPSRLAGLVEKLLRTNLLEEFVSERPPFSFAFRKRFGAILEMPASEVSAFHRHLANRLSDEDSLFSGVRAAVEEKLTNAVPSRVLYLPTYRRIEKDLRDIFPHFDERYRRIAGEVDALQAGRAGSSFLELVSFGMEDVRANVAKVTQGLRDYSLSQYNNLSASYLRDVIKGQATQYTARELNSLTDDDITKILNRVSEAALSADDKVTLRKKIKNIQNKKKNETDVNDRYLAHYFARLVAITSEISERESNIASFISVCNKYIEPSKSIVYDEVSFALKIVDDRERELDLSVLSSGEKQIVSLFSHMYLDDTREQIVVIDEPELSLSVPWQRMFLTDIMRTERTAFLLAVTHSPFVYDNELKPLAVDLRKLTTRKN